MEWLMWFTKFENTKPLAMLIFLTVFLLILYYVYGSRRRGQQLETFKNIPFLDDIQGEIQDEKGKQS